MNWFFSIVILISCSCSLGFAQEREQTVEEMNVSFTRLQRYSVDSLHAYLSREDIETLQPDDLGELLKKIPGANVKAFGALGGLKTVSIRGLGSQHTNFVVDGFSIMNTQTGQVNLSQVQLDNVESVIVQRGGSSEITVPASAQLYGNTIILETYQSKAPAIPLQKRLFSKVGSFGQFDQDFIGKTGSKKFFGGIYLKYRYAHGKYAYTINNYNTAVKGTRNNNDYADLNAGFNLHYTPFKGHDLNLYYLFTQVDQGLPGAIVLYNDYGRQRLFTSNYQFKADYKGKLGKVNYRLHWNHLHDSIKYTDPDYLNAAGELVSTFVTTTHNTGITFSLPLFKRIHLNWGTEEVFSTLSSRESLNASPRRAQNFSFVKASYGIHGFLFIGQLGYQLVHERNDNGLAANDLNRWNPYLEIRKEFNKHISAYTYYRHSFRMPNFNELYYNNIGNLQLKPEDADQLAAGVSLKLIDARKFYLGLQGGAYYHEVDNLILATPTKNLFVWSIRNIGKNQITGADAILSVSWAMSKNWNTNIVSNYAYQESIDLSDPTSPTYRNQIAYTPKHVLNVDWTLQFKGIGLRLSTFSSSMRYALNENISANEVPGFTTFDLALFSKHRIDAHNSIRLQLTIKNITNEQYVFVRNYVMPGRNYLITFRYAFH